MDYSVMKRDEISILTTWVKLRNTMLSKVRKNWYWMILLIWIAKKVICKKIIYSYVYQIAENAMATHSCILAWEIPWTEGPGRLQSMGSLGVRHDWATSLSLFTFMHWRRKWQPTPVFSPGESQGQRSLVVGCRLWSRTESDATEVT